MYDNPGFQVIERSTNYEQVSKTVAEVTKKGVESWQVNFCITHTGVSLTKYFQLKL
jgi:sugar fermentation stimulation protein A